MDWKDILIGNAVNTVIAIAQSGEGKGKFRKALMKLFRVIALNVATADEVRSALQGKGVE